MNDKHARTEKYRIKVILCKPTDFGINQNGIYYIKFARIKQTTVINCSSCNFRRRQKKTHTDK